MDFIKKTELFFIQLQYCLTIEPEPILEGDKGHYSLMLKPDTFLKLINDFQIEYPFIPENKIIELKGLINKENIKTVDALKIIENYKKQYWGLDTVIMFEPVTNKIKRTLKSIDSNISEKEINIELANYQKHLQAKREKIYFDLINEIKGLPNQHTVSKFEKKTNKTISSINLESNNKFMNPELDQIALRYAGKLFPDFLYIIEDNHDYNFVKSDKSIFDDKLIYEYITNDYRLRNLNIDQTEYIFKTVEIKYSKFLKKEWFEFNSLTRKFYKQENKSKLPEELHFLIDNNFIEHVRNNIESNKLKIIENYKKIKEYIFITRQKELNSSYILLQSMFNQLPIIKEYSNEEVNEYIQKWVDLSVSLVEWQQHKNINLDEEIEHLKLEDKAIQEIMQHKFNLFNELKNKIVKNRFLDPFETIFPESDKIITARRDFDLIESLIDGKIDEIKEIRLKQTLHINNWKETALHFDYIYRHKYKNEFNYDIHHEDSFLDAHIIISYKKYLFYFLSSIDNNKQNFELKPKNIENDKINIIPDNKISNTNIKHKSFKYTNNDSTRLPDLMNALIKANFIDKETEIKQFRKIFSGNEIDKQIIWIGNISELSYFIKSIHNIHKKIDNTKQKIWEITYQCFIQSDGTSFDKSKFRGQKAPVKKTIIDKIVKIL